MIGKYGSGFQLLNITEIQLLNIAETPSSLFIIYIVHTNGSFQLQWRNGGNVYTLKCVPTQRTFLVDATLDWSTATARVTVDGAEFERPLPFRPLPVRAMGFQCGEWPGRSTFGPFDVWYSNTPPPIPSARFEGER